MPPGPDRRRGAWPQGPRRRPRDRTRRLDRTRARSARMGRATGTRRGPRTAARASARRSRRTPGPGPRGPVPASVSSRPSIRGRPGCTRGQEGRGEHRVPGGRSQEAEVAHDAVECIRGHPEAHGDRRHHQAGSHQPASHPRCRVGWDVRSEHHQGPARRQHDQPGPVIGRADDAHPRVHTCERRRHDDGDPDARWWGQASVHGDPPDPQEQRTQREEHQFGVCERGA